MQPIHQSTSNTRVKIYHGRCDLKKRQHLKNARQSGSLKKVMKQKGRVRQHLRSKIIYTNYTNFEKPPHLCGIRLRNKKQNNNSAG